MLFWSDPDPVLKEEEKDGSYPVLKEEEQNSDPDPVLKEESKVETGSGIKREKQSNQVLKKQKKIKIGSVSSIIRGKNGRIGIWYFSCLDYPDPKYRI